MNRFGFFCLTIATIGLLASVEPAVSAAEPPNFIFIMDRDTKFSDAFRKTLEDEGVESVRLPPRSPNLNPHLERYMRSLKDESLSRLIFFGETSLRTAVGQFLEHYHGERNHQGLGNQLIDPGEEVGQSQGAVKCRERLGGLLRYYYRDAA